MPWVLDVAFQEDVCRVGKRQAPQHGKILRHLSLNLLKQETSEKASITAKPRRAGWDGAFLETVLAEPQQKHTN